MVTRIIIETCMTVEWLKGAERLLVNQINFLLLHRRGRI